MPDGRGHEQPRRPLVGMEEFHTQSACQGGTLLPDPRRLGWVLDVRNYGSFLAPTMHRQNGIAAQYKVPKNQVCPTFGERPLWIPREGAVQVPGVDRSATSPRKESIRVGYGHNRKGSPQLAGIYLSRHVLQRRDALVFVAVDTGYQ